MVERSLTGRKVGGSNPLSLSKHKQVLMTTCSEAVEFDFARQRDNLNKGVFGCDNIVTTSTFRKSRSTQHRL